MKFFRIQKTIGNWGDYSDILLHGMASRDSETGLLNLERTGPFVPPISFPTLESFSVTDSLRSEIERSLLSGITFRPITKKRIVNLNWQDWNLQAEEPEFYPKSGEPEDYILRRKHSPQVACQMPELWEAVIQEGAHVKRVEKKRRLELFLLRDSWNGADIFRSPEVLYIFMTPKGKSWFELHVPEYMAFEEMPLSPR
jgi:hypothetical protein